MTALPALPPKARGPLARRLTSAAARGAFELPVCEACGAVQYPLRQRCRMCCSGKLAWREVSAAGTLLARTSVRHSSEPYFQSRRPVPLGSVKLDAGPVAIAFVAGGCGEPGSRVRLLNRLDRAGEAVFIAVPAEGTSAGENVMSDPNCEIAGKVVLITGANGGIGRALVAAFRSSGAAEVLEIGGLGAPEGMTRLDGPIARGRGAGRRAGARVDILVNNAG